MLDAFLKAIGQLSDPRVRRVLLLSVAGAFFVLFGVWIAAGLAFASVPDTWAQGLPGWVPSWVPDLLLSLGWLGAFFLSWVLFPPLVTVVMGCFLEPVIEAVEQRHYPQLPAARSQSLSEVIIESLNFFLLALFVNLLVLPLYLLLPGINIVLFLAVNGILLGREYFDMVALRRADRKAVAELRRRHRSRIALWGAVLAVVLLVPVVNLLAPVVAAAMMVHLYQSLPAGNGRA